MNKAELIALLDEISMAQTSETETLADHPCSVAIRAINQCFEDVGTLQQQVIKLHRSSSSPLLKEAVKLVQVTYNPEW